MPKQIKGQLIIISFTGQVDTIFSGGFSSVFIWSRVFHDKRKLRLHGFREI